MASTYSDLKVELIGTGDQSGAWGTTTNTNLGTALGEAITGSADVSFSSADVTVTLTDVNTSQTARNLRLNLTGTTGGARNLILGSGCQIEKLYLINNGTADTVTVKNTTGTGIAVPAGKSMFVFNNGTNVVDAVTHLTSLTLGTDLAVADGGTGASTFTANNVLLGNGTSAFQVVAPGSTGNVLTSNGTTWTSAAGASLATPLAVVGNATAGSEIRLPEDTDNGSNYVALKAADSLAANVTFTLPNADGTSGQVIQTNGSGTLSFVTAGGGADLQEFTSSGTWTKPSGATFVMVECWGAGGGGGGGFSYKNSGPSLGDAGGGGGGGGGAYTYRLFKASDLASTVSVTIGAGGSGGASGTTNGGGGGGTAGGNSTFGSHLTSYGGGAGEVGTSGTGTTINTFGGKGGGVLGVGNIPKISTSSTLVGSGQFGGASVNALVTSWTNIANAQFSSGFGGGAGGPAGADQTARAGGCSYQGGAGGGSGGGYNYSNGQVATNGAAGGSRTGETGGGAARNTASSTNFFGGGGGDGAGSNSAAATAVAGGAGGIAAGGGGGGGAAAGAGFAVASGAGGAGGAGLCRVYTW